MKSSGSGSDIIWNKFGSVSEHDAMRHAGNTQKKALTDLKHVVHVLDLDALTSAPTTKAPAGRDSHDEYDRSGSDRGRNHEASVASVITCFVFSNKIIIKGQGECGTDRCFFKKKGFSCAPCA